MTTERKQPQHTVFVPPGHIWGLVLALLSNGCTFTCEPSPREPDVWHVGVFDDGLRVVSENFGPTHEIGTLGDYL